MVLVRFNHDATNELERWRVLVNGVEYLATNVSFLCETHTSKDTIPLPDGSETIKYHIQAKNYKAIVRNVADNGEINFTIK